MTRTSLSALLPLVALVAGCASAPPDRMSAQGAACKIASEGEVSALFDRWNASLQSGEPLKVVANYANRSVLLATVSNTPRVDPAQKEDYFKKFLENRPSGRIDWREIQADCNTALDTGLYTFTFARTGDIVKARYTFTYKWSGDQWLITSHHSSAMPEK